MIFVTYFIKNVINGIDRYKSRRESEVRLTNVYRIGGLTGQKSRKIALFCLIPLLFCFLSPVAVVAGNSNCIDRTQSPVQEP